VVAAPAGTVTFLLTDLEGSTRLWEEQPDAMRVGLARHDELLREVIESRRGHVVKMTGDGVYAPGGPLTRRRVPDPAVDAEVARRYEAGESFAAIGEVFEHSRTWAFYVVERMGLERRRISERRRHGPR
jgi:class 3 adenylate cyclase